MNLDLKHYFMLIAVVAVMFCIGYSINSASRYSAISSCYKANGGDKCSKIE